MKLGVIWVSNVWWTNSCFKKEEKTVIDIHKTSLPFIQSLDIRSRREQENVERNSARKPWTIHSTRKEFHQQKNPSINKKKRDNIRRNQENIWQRKKRE